MCFVNRKEVAGWKTRARKIEKGEKCANKNSSYICSKYTYNVRTLQRLYAGYEVEKKKKKHERFLFEHSIEARHKHNKKEWICFAYRKE